MNILKKYASWISISPLSKEKCKKLISKKILTLLSLAILVWAITSISASGQNIYRTACQGNIDRLDSLLMNTPVNQPDENGRTLLHWAVACNQDKVIDYLVEKDIAINKEDQEGNAPIFMAVRFENKVFFDKLLSLQKDLAWTSKYGASMLEKAVLNESKTFVRKLVALGVDVDVVNQRGSTALEMATRMNSEAMIFLLDSLGADPTLVREFDMKGAYMDQEEPGLAAKIFAPNFISTEEYEFGSVFNRAQTEFYYGVNVNGRNEIRFSERLDGRWNKPRVLLADGKYGYNDPFLSPDENRLYFISDRALDGQGGSKDIDIWYIERDLDGWSEPINAGPNINSEAEEYYISFTRDGTMFFATNVNAPEDRNRRDHDIYSSKFIDGTFQPALALGSGVNTSNYEADVFVDPDLSYLIFCSTRPEGMGRGDLYISFMGPDGKWSEATNMGTKVNSSSHELCPFVTADGKFLLYTSDEDIYWISTEIIQELRPGK